MESDAFVVHAAHDQYVSYGAIRLVRGAVTHSHGATHKAVVQVKSWYPEYGLNDAIGVQPLLKL